MTVTNWESGLDESHTKAKISPREYPIIHPTSDAPLCNTCQQLDLPFFDTNCPECLEILHRTETTVSQIFAIIRQWIPETQQNIEMLATEILKRGAHVDDRDGLTDMTLLHYACKAGAVGVGDDVSAAQTVQMLLERGCDVHLRCRWTDMSALHYAVYFDVVPILKLLLESDNIIDINSPCQEYEGGSSLHIAAANLCVEATKFLLKQKANFMIKDQLDRTPYDCIPEISSTENVSDITNIISKLRTLLGNKAQYCDYNYTDYTTITGKTILKSMQLKLGDKVIVGGAKVGDLRYCGTTKFATGIWAGVELEEPLGKNDGTLDGVKYFKCQPYHGIFAPVSKICKYSESAKNNVEMVTSQRSLLPKYRNYKKIDVSHVTSKIETGLTTLKPQMLSKAKELIVGDKIFMGCKSGIIKYVGETQFASGIWYGIELDEAEGKNNGSVQGIKYFNCKPSHGIFVPISKLSKLQKYSDDSSSQSSISKNSSIGRNSINCENERRQSESPNVYRSSKKSRCSTPTANISNNTKNSKGCWLTVGMNVFINNEIATVKYLGNVAFAEGVWIGVELRKPKGKNDGRVQGYRYFTCKPCHGLIVRPNRITVRGINGSKLIQTEN